MPSTSSESSVGSVSSGLSQMDNITNQTTPQEFPDATELEKEETSANDSRQEPPTEDTEMTSKDGPEKTGDQQNTTGEEASTMPNGDHNLNGETVKTEKDLPTESDADKSDHQEGTPKKEITERMRLEFRTDCPCVNCKVNSSLCFVRLLYADYN
jgi:hypothetical protein